MIHTALSFTILMIVLSCIFVISSHTPAPLKLMDEPSSTSHEHDMAWSYHAMNAYHLARV